MFCFGGLYSCGWCVCVQLTGHKLLRKWLVLFIVVGRVVYPPETLCRREVLSVPLGVTPWELEEVVVSFACVLCSVLCRECACQAVCETVPVHVTRIHDIAATCFTCAACNLVSKANLQVSKAVSMKTAAVTSSNSTRHVPQTPCVRRHVRPLSHGKGTPQSS